MNKSVITIILSIWLFFGLLFVGISGTRKRKHLRYFFLWPYTIVLMLHELSSSYDWRW